MTRILPEPRLLRHRLAFAVSGAAGLLATFGAMLAAGDAERLGAVALVPWVALLGAESGVLGGACSGAAATGLYLLAAHVVGGRSGAVEAGVRGVAIVGVGIAAGIAGRRLRESARGQQSVLTLQRALLDATLDAICLTDGPGNPLIANAPMRRLAVELGLPPHGTVPGRLLTIAERTTAPERFRERMLALAAEPESETADEFELAESGRVFRGFTGPVHERDGSFLGRIWTLREVTQDRELDRLRDAFLASVSHELRTPLTSISGFLEMLDDEEHALGEKGRRYLAVIRRSTARLQRLVEDLLLVAQLEAGRVELDVEPLELAEVAGASAEAARPVADAKGVQLIVHRNGGARVQGDAQRLGQVLDNLVSNAVKFTASGGVVTVSTAAGGGWGRVVVADTGVGIPDDEQERLFSRFFRASSATSRAIPGTGLGLSIARALVEQHGGSIALESREGEGTRVTVALPVQLSAGGA